MAVDSVGNVYVAEQDRVQKFDTNGVFLRKWGSRGSGDGDFLIASGVAVDFADNIYVADFDNHRIQKFDGTGTFLTKVGSAGRGLGVFRNPGFVAALPKNLVQFCQLLKLFDPKIQCEKIFVSEEGDVELVVPDVQALNANLELDRLERTMEEMAGAPREAMGIRSPGEKTKYEVQRLENASSRLFQNKIFQFSEFLDMLLNSMLELARRNMTGVSSIRVFNDDFQTTTFENLTVDDITGIGRIKAIGARHFAEQAELVQNLTSLTGSGLWQTVQPHFSGIVLAKILESTFDLKDYGVVTPYIQLAEQADAQRYIQAMQEQLHQETGTATGMGGDYDVNPQTGQPSTPTQQTRPGQQMGLQRNPSPGATPTGTIGTQ